MIASLLVWTDLTASAVTDQNHGFRIDTNPRCIRCRRNSDPEPFVSRDRGCLHDPQPHIPDFVHPRTRGEPPADLDNSLRFGGGLLRLSGRDPAVHKLMMGVRQLIEPRSALSDPELVRRVESGMMADTRDG